MKVINLFLILFVLYQCTVNAKEKRLDFKDYFASLDLKRGYGSSNFNLQVFDVLAPFPAAPREDVDVLDAWGGILNIPRADNSTYPSDLVFGGQTGWTKITADEETGLVEIGYESSQVNWTLIEAWAGSSGAYFSGWALSDFTLDQDEDIIISCSGVSKFYVDDVVMMGDTYGSGIQFNSISLLAGNHTVRIRLMSAEGAEFICSIIVNNIESSPEFMVVYQDILQSSSIQGVGFTSPYVSMAILNCLNDTSIQSMNVISLTDDFVIKYLPPVNSNGEVYGDELQPGQTKPINFMIFDVNGAASNCSPGVVFGVPIQVISNQGESILFEMLNFTCLTYGDPYVFTFLDFDSSVQYAVATPPLNPCPPTTGCPVLITFHGADVEAKSHAWTSAYSRQNDSWILFPTNRRNYGFDWQGPGFKDGFQALTYFTEELPGVPNSLKSISKANPYQLQYAGHSMGSHGVQVAATHRPDRAVSVSIAAGWIDMEIYTPFFLKLGYSWSDPWLRFILEASISEYNSDLYSPHLINLPLLFRMGSDDTNVPPFHLRRMNRLYGELRHNKTAGVVSEIPGEGHWFNGVVDDAFMQAFFNQYVNSGIPPLPSRFIVTTLNPASFESKGGISIQQLQIPYRISKIQVIQSGTSNIWTLTTENIARFGFQSNFPYKPKTVIIDGQTFPYIQLPQHYCYQQQQGSESKLSNRQRKQSKSSLSSSSPNNWSICNDSSWQVLERSPLNYGPMAQIIENPLLLVYGTIGNEDETSQRKALAIYLSNVLYYQERYSITVVPDYDTSDSDLEIYDMILIGGPTTNKLSQILSPVFPVDFDSDGISFSIGSNTFSTPSTGIAFLSPCYDQEIITANKTSIRPGCMVSVLEGTDSIGLEQAINLFPTKSATQMPDYAVAGPTYTYAGDAGLLALGFWDNNWNYQESLSYITSIVN